MKDISATSFGYLIAFLLPGIFGLYALSRWFPEINTSLQPILKADATVGPSLVFLAIAVGVGVCISGVRYFAFEKAIFRRGPLPKGTYQGMSAEELTLHKAIVDEHYRYHQFYGGCAVASLILYAGWIRAWHHSLCQSIGWTLGFAALELLLMASACDSFKKYDDCRRERHEKAKVAAK